MDEDYVLVNGKLVKANTSDAEVPDSGTVSNSELGYSDASGEHPPTIASNPELGYSDASGEHAPTVNSPGPVKPQSSPSPAPSGYASDAIQIPKGFMVSQNETAWREMVAPDTGLGWRIFYGFGFLLSAPGAIVEETGRGIANIPYKFSHGSEAVGKGEYATAATDFAEVGLNAWGASTLPKLGATVLNPAREVYIWSRDKTPLQNLFPEDLPKNTGVFELQFKDGKWRTISSSGDVFDARGNYTFITRGDKILVGRSGPLMNPRRPDAFHLDLSGGAPVDYAGKVRFSGTGNRGVLRSWTNDSGHYKPPADMAWQADLPLEKFQATIPD